MSTYTIERTVTVVETYAVQADDEGAALNLIYHGIVEPVDSDDQGDGEYTIVRVERDEDDAPTPDGPAVHVAIVYGDEGHPSVTVDGHAVPAERLTVELLDETDDEDDTPWVATLVGAAEPATLLVWESADHDGAPGDQNADTRLVAHGFWSLGSVTPGRWGVELIVQDEDLTEIPADGVHLGYFDTETAAKAAAETYEREHQP